MVFGQRDYNEELGTGVGATIHDYGCALTSVASLLLNCFGKNTDPLQLNQALINVGGFASNGGSAHDILDWGAITKVYGDVTLAFNNSYPSSPADLGLIDGQLSKGCSVVVGVSFNHVVSDTQASHYVELYRKNGDGMYQCRDPWYKDDVQFNSRYAVNGMSVAQCILQAVSYNGSVESAGTYVDAATFGNLVHKSTLYDAFNAAGYATIDDVIKKVGEYTNEIGVLKTQLQSATEDVKTKSDQAADLAGELQKVHQDDSQTASQLLDAQHKVSDLQAKIDQVVKLTSSQSFDEAVGKITDDEKTHSELVKNVQPVITSLGDAAIYKKAPSPKPSQVKAVVNYLRGFFHI